MKAPESQLAPDVVVAQMLRGRESVCTVGRFSFDVRRPTEMDLVRWRGEGGQVEVNLACMERCVFGWHGVLESDIVPGSSGDPYPFHITVWRQFIADRADVWEALSRHIMEQVNAHGRKIEELAKNSVALSTG